MKFELTKTPDGVPVGDLSFEEQTYECARRWALSRRDLLRTGAGFGTAALLMSFPGAKALAQNRGGALIVGRAAGSDTLDPHKAGLISSSEILTHIFDPLAVLDPATGRAFPSLALSWEFDDGNKTVLFKLRPGVEFHDGTPFNAEAVAMTVKRHRDPKTASRNKFLLGPLASVEVVNELTVAYRYKQPYVAIWASFFLPYTSPLSPAAAATFGQKFGRNPIGTGPFKFVSWDSSDTIRLVRNDKRNWNSPYYKNTGASYIDSVEYRTFPEPSTRVAALLSGEINLIAGAGDAVPTDKVQQLKRTPGIKVESQPALGIYAFTFVRSKSPTDDIRIRQAISHALNREKALAFVLNGNGKVAYSPLASGFLNYNAETKNIGYLYDPAKAKKLLAAAGHARGLVLTYLGNDTVVSRFLGEVLQADLAAVGVKLKIETVPAAEFSAVRRKGRTHLVYTNYSFVEPTILRSLLANGAPLNFSNASHDRLGKLAPAEVVEFDPEKRRQIHFEMQKIVVSEALWLPVVEGDRVAAMRENVHIRTKADGTVIMNDVWIG